MEWSMHEIVQAAGTTSRTLRHYDQIGLLPPSHTGSNGYRYYDQDSLVRLQRILLLRDLGMGLPAIADLLAGEQDTVTALREHLAQLAGERERVDRLIGSVQSTIDKLEGGEELVASEVFDGFDHTQYKGEVEERWGKQAYADSDRWWRSLDDAGKQGFREELERLVEEFGIASARGLDVHSQTVQALAQRQYDWIRTAWGGKPPSAEAFIGLGQLYVDDPRYGGNYEADGRNFAEYVRDAMTAYAETHLS